MLRLPRLFSDHLVLQRDRELPVWGWANPGVSLTVTLRGTTVETQAGADGRWEVILPAQRECGPTDLRFAADDGWRKELLYVLIGDVFFASGQSNMQWSVKDAQRAEEFKAAAEDEELRLFHTGYLPSTMPATDLELATWKVANAASIEAFSAVAYHFGRHRRISDPEVPVGIIHGSWGGTKLVNWLPEQHLEAWPDELENFRKVHASGLDLAAEERRDAGTELQQEEKRKEVEANTSPDCAQIDFDDRSWKTYTVPHRWSEFIDGNSSEGMGWYRCHFKLPESWAGRRLELRLGRIEQEGTYFVNGRLVASSPPNSPPGVYPIPEKLVEPGENLLAIRVIHTWRQGGGLWEGPYQLADADTGETLDLPSEWKLDFEAEGAWPSRRWAAFYPAVLYNGMVNPLTPFAVRGFLWYQGESDADIPHEYVQLLKTLIEVWRERFRSPEALFYIVQLANWREPHEQPLAYDEWAELRAAQAQVVEEVENTGLAVIIDLGDAEDIHPRNKHDVGKRLELWAQRDIDGKAICPKGPSVKSIDFAGSEATLAFEASGGLELRGSLEKAFAVLCDGDWHWAEAKQAGAVITVKGLQGRTIDGLRYAWEVNPRAPIYDGQGLPAVPFQCLKG